MTRNNIIKNAGEEFLTHEFIKNHLDKKLQQYETITSWDQLPNPYHFKGMAEAVNIFTEAVNNNKSIVIVHDSDMDGLGTYLLSWQFYKTFYYPKVKLKLVVREKGYGFIPDHLTGLQAGDLVITADNGITSIEACQQARTLGIKTIITDHHQVDQKRGLPDADAIINPHQPDCSIEFKDINGTVVYWYFLKALVDNYGIQLDMLTFLPELMLTTISDVMPLHGPNRFMVKEGLKNLKNYTYKKWIDIFLKKNSGDITAESLAFGLIPAMNAAGRLTKTDDALWYFLKEDDFGCDNALEHCQTINNTRKELQQNLMQHIKIDYSTWLDFDFIIIPGSVQDKKHFRKGLLGPTSGRLAEEYKKPCIVMTSSADGKSFSGSGRSVGNVDILSILKDNPYTVQEKTGGHKAACGVTVLTENFENFWKYMQTETAKIPKEMYIKDQHILGKIELRDINMELFELLEKYEPYGKDFNKPTFITRGKLTSLRKIGKDKNHYAMEIVDGLGTKHRVMWFFFTEELDKSQNISITFTLHRDDPQYGNKDGVALFVESIGDYEDWLY